jgi:hypothetical protein
MRILYNTVFFKLIFASISRLALFFVYFSFAKLNNLVAANNQIEEENINNAWKIFVLEILFIYSITKHYLVNIIYI